MVDEKHLESTVAKVMHPEREAWAKALARAVELERTTRTSDVEQERAQRESEIARLNAAVQRLLLHWAECGPSGTSDALLREEVDRCLDCQRDQMSNMERRLSDFMS